MPFVTILTQNTTHPSCKTPVVDSNQSIVTIQNLTVNVMGGTIASHKIHHHKHSSPKLTNNSQSYVTINGLPIFVIGDGGSCGTILCPDPQSKKSKQQFIQIN